MVFIVGALVILAYCSDVNQSCTYQDVLHSICGKLSKHACSLSVALYCFGTCVTFFIIIADQWDRCKINTILVILNINQDCKNKNIICSTVFRIL